MKKLLERPAFKHFFHVEVVENQDVVFLVAEHTHRILTGRVCRHLAPLLNGQHTVSEIIDQVAGKVTATEVYFMVQQLAAGGLLVEGNGSIPSQEAAFWQLLGADAHTAATRLNQGVASLRLVGKVAADPLLASLNDLQIGVAEEGVLDVVLTDDYLREEVEEINEQAVASGRPWLLAKLVGNIAWIGPLFTPPDSACWACLAQRLNGNRQVESYIMGKRGQTTPLPTSVAAIDSVVHMAAHMAATEIARWLAQGQNDLLRNQVVTYDSVTAEMQRHVLVRRPQCPVCGDPAFLASFRQPKPIQLAPSKKRHISDGGHRCFLPEETLKRYEHHISPITGVITRLTTSLHNNSLIYSFTASHNFVLMSDDMASLHQNLTTRSGGKGMTETQARVSAMSEAIERYTGVYRGNDEIMIRASYNELGPPAVHLHDCLLYSEKQYDNPPPWHGTEMRNLVPFRFDPDRQIDWTPIWSLTRSEFRYIPTSYCYYGHPDLRLFFSDVNSNGCAAGNTLEEAILQGSLELIERDAVALWWYNYARRPAVDFDSFNMPYFEMLRQHYQKHNRAIWALDITTDLGIPAFVAVSARTDGREQGIIAAFGCHLDPKIGLLRALTEVNQRLPDVSHVQPDGSIKYPFSGEKLQWLYQATLEKEPYLAPDPAQKARTYQDYPQLYSDDIKTDIETCVSILQKAGLEMLVLDQTRPDVGMSVCRVVVPGLRHYLRRLGPGRLYDVPVQLGWAMNRIAEEELNPHSVSVCF